MARPTLPPMSDDGPDDDEVDATAIALPDFGAVSPEGLGGLLEQAQSMMAAQQAASEQEIEGVAGGGVVRIRTTGTGQVLGVTIAPEVVDPADVAMLEDLVTAALHDMNAKLLEIQREAMGPLGGPRRSLRRELMANVYAQPVQELIDELGRLPGVGPKSAQRIAFHLLKVEKVDALRLAHAITEAKDRVTFCERCFNIAEGHECGLCARRPPRRHDACVVEEPRDIVAVEKTQEFNGRYHVLQGAISPIEGIGPEQLRIRELLARIEPEGVQEVILCTNPNLEGEATAMYLGRLLKDLAGEGDAHRQRPAGGRRPRVRRRAHARAGPRGPPRGRRLTPSRNARGTGTSSGRADRPTMQPVPQREAAGAGGPAPATLRSRYNGCDLMTSPDVVAWSARVGTTSRRTAVPSRGGREGDDVGQAAHQRQAEAALVAEPTGVVGRRQRVDVVGGEPAGVVGDRDGHGRAHRARWRPATRLGDPADRWASMALAQASDTARLRSSMRRSVSTSSSAGGGGDDAAHQGQVVAAGRDLEVDRPPHGVSPARDGPRRWPRRPCRRAAGRGRGAVSSRTLRRPARVDTSRRSPPGCGCA